MPNTQEPSIAEQTAEREGWAVVAVATSELIGVAQGHPIRVDTLDGKPMLLRLMTAEEAIDAQRKGLAYMASLGVPDGPPLMSLERAAELVKPLPEW